MQGLLTLIGLGLALVIPAYFFIRMLRKWGGDSADIEGAGRGMGDTYWNNLNDNTRK
jgi:hypothetical protein